MKTVTPIITKIRAIQSNAEVPEAAAPPERLLIHTDLTNGTPLCLQITAAAACELVEALQKYLRR